MGNTPEISLEDIRQYGFAPLPPRIGRADEENKDGEKTDKVAVQCQVCGRMGMMSLEEMKNHHAQHEEV